MNYFDFHIGDYLKKTQGLSTYEHGVYIRFLLVYYGEEKPLPGDAKSLCDLCGARTVAERTAVIKVADKYFPVLDDGMRYNKRADEVIELYHQRSKINSENGKLGGKANAKRIESKKEATASNSPKRNEGLPETSNHSPVTIPSNQYPREGNTSPPSVQEVADYFATIGHPGGEQEAQKFIANYAAVNWMSGSTPIRDWRQKAVQWKLNAGSIPRGKKIEPTSQAKHDQGF
jgi:uncharacterized protein YdaU (DUF1376 family)